jgi:hypothetical protein
MDCYRSNHTDVYRYYHQTVIRDDKVPDQFVKVHVETSRVAFYNANGDRVVQQQLSDNPMSGPAVVLDYVMPGKSIYTVDNGVYVLIRKPAKQYYRGIHELNSELWYNKGTGWFEKPVTHPHLQALLSDYRGTTLSKIAETLKNKDNKFGAAALSPTISVDKAGQLFCYTTPVGLVSFNKRTINVNPLFRAWVTPIADNFLVSRI